MPGKTAASLPSLVVEMHEQSLRNQQNVAVCLAGYGTAPVASKLHRKALSSGRTSTSHALETVQTISDLIMEDRRITIDEVQG
jgi:Tfp pilus assembly pilus retraction ATPase PilT